MLTDEKILEILQISTKLLLHYESMLAQNEGISRSYVLDHSTIDGFLTRADKLLVSDGRPAIRTYGGFGFVDNAIVTRLLAHTLDIVHLRYGIEHDLHSAVRNVDT